ncbi:Transmembrane protein 145 [Durusdinium trenchii]|uniref:Transmembrane protein 145 n=1 Tax=Durusdinium trenchii TaxID=1381693 RepID=A0ABP0RGW1_9DINO
MPIARARRAFDGSLARVKTGLADEAAWSVRAVAPLPQPNTLGTRRPQPDRGMEEHAETERAKLARIFGAGKLARSSGRSASGTSALELWDPDLAREDWVSDSAKEEKEEEQTWADLDEQYRGSDSWVFLDRFCFGKEDGRFDGEFLFPAGQRPTLMLYYLESGIENEFGTWEKLYDGELNCTEKAAIARDTSGSVFELDSLAYSRTIEMIDGKPFLRARVRNQVVTSRSRWFFFAVGNCPSACEEEFCVGGVDLFWSFNFTNGQGSNMYFGADQDSVWATCVTFFALYLGLMAYSLYVRLLLLGRRKYHVTVFLLIASIWLTFGRLLCDLILYTVYRNLGEFLQVQSTMSMVLAGTAEMLLLVMLMLIMKGWTIVRRKISANGRTRLSVYVMIYVSAYWTCMLYFTNGVDPANVVYVYDTWPGYILLVLRVGLLIWIIRARSVTVRKYNSKRAFYQKFTALACMWAVSLPLLVGLNEILPEYMRFKLLYALELLILFLTHAVLISLYNPQIGASFPFHATTAAMLHNKSGAARGTGASTAAGLAAASLNDIQLRQASEIGRRIKHGLSVLHAFSNDLSTFLEEIDPTEQELLNNDEELPGSHGNATSPGEVGNLTNVSISRPSNGSFRSKRSRNVDPKPIITGPSTEKEG